MQFTFDNYSDNQNVLLHPLAVSFHHDEHLRGCPFISGPERRADAGCIAEVADPGDGSGGLAKGARVVDPLFRWASSEPYYAEDPQRLVVVPEALPLAEAAMLCEVIPKANHLAEAADVMAGDTVIVAGNDAVSLACIQVCRLKNAIRIISVGGGDAYNEAALASGAHVAFKSADEISGVLADRICICSGSMADVSALLPFAGPLAIVAAAAPLSDISKTDISGLQGASGPADRRLRLTFGEDYADPRKVSGFVRLMQAGRINAALLRGARREVVVFQGEKNENG